MKQTILEATEVRGEEKFLAKTVDLQAGEIIRVDGPHTEAELRKSFAEECVPEVEIEQQIATARENRRASLKPLVHDHKPYRLVALPTATGWKAAVYKIEGGQTNDCYRPDQIFKTAKEAQAEAVIWTEGVSHERITSPVWRDSI